MSTRPAPTLLSPGVHDRLAAVGRWCVGVVMSGLVAGVVFLVMVEGSQHKGFTDITFNHSLGVLIGGEGTQARTDAALGVAGDTAAPTGLAWFAFFAVATMAVYGLTIHRWLKRPWYVTAVPLGFLVFLFVSLVYFPLIDANVPEVSVGLFGVGGGGITPVVYLISSFGFAYMATRAFSLAVQPWWWEIRGPDAEQALTQIGSAPVRNVTADSVGIPVEGAPRPSLELPEQRPDDGDERARR